MSKEVICLNLENLKDNLKTTGIICLLFLALAVPLSIAAYWVYSNQVSVTVEEYVLSLSPSAQTLVKYQLANFTATLNLNGNPQAGQTVFLLFVNSTATGISAVTNSTGHAVLQWNATGTADFIASYEVP